MSEFHHELWDYEGHREGYFIPAQFESIEAFEQYKNELEAVEESYSDLPDDFVQKYLDDEFNGDVEEFENFLQKSNSLSLNMDVFDAEDFEIDADL